MPYCVCCLFYERTYFQTLYCARPSLLWTPVMLNNLKRWKCLTDHLFFYRGSEAELEEEIYWFIFWLMLESHPHERESEPAWKENVKCYLDTLENIHYNQLFSVLMTRWDTELMKGKEMQRSKHIISHLLNPFWERIENFLFLFFWWKSIMYGWLRLNCMLHRSINSTTMLK